MLPTKSNRLHRGIISAQATVCAAGCGHLKTTQHLFLSCNMYGSLWQFVRSWIGISGADHHSISDHFSQFIYSSGGLKARRFFLQFV